MSKNIFRYSDRAQNYKRYRPSYPEEAISWILAKCDNSEKRIFADIGSGTGIFTKLLIPKAKLVYGVEPNLEMRSAAENDLNCYSNFISINGKGEQTGLEKESVDHITVAQAFHWLDQVEAFREFARILKKDGSVFLIWNLRSTNEEFMMAYENLLLQSSGDYKRVSVENKVDFDALSRQMPIDFEIKSFFFEKECDWEEFVGRHNSSAYAPREFSEENNEILDKAKELFMNHAELGKLRFYYETKVYYGKIRL